MKKVLVFLSVLLIILMSTTLISAQKVDHSGFEDSGQCFECHGYQGVTMEKEGKSVSVFVDKKAYDTSVHASVDCLSCHQFNDESEKESSQDIFQKCADCHSGAVADFQLSVHQNSSYAPSCLDCHGNVHTTLPVSNPASPVVKKNVGQTCATCHGGVIIESYQSSFHGKAVALGAKNSPDCTDCHSDHKVLSQDDPLSLTNPDLKPQLCGDCHPGGAIGIDSKEHYSMQATGYSAPMYWINKAFMWLILLVVGFFLIHIILDLLHKLRTRKS